MPVVLAPHVQLLGIGKLVRIAIRRAQVEEEPGATSDGPPAQLHVLDGNAGHGLGRPVVAHELLDGQGGQARVGGQSRQLGGMPEQGHDPVADQVRRGFVPGEKQQHAGCHQLVLAESVLPPFGGEHGSHHVVPGLGPARGHQGVKVAGHVDHGSLGAGTFVWSGERTPHEGGEIIGPALDPVEVVHGSAEHAGNDGGRERIGKIRDQVRLPGRSDGVEEAVHDALDDRFPALDRARGKRGIHDASKPRVLGRVGEHCPVAEPLDQIGDARMRLCRQVLREGRDPIRREASIQQRVLDVVVSRENPAAQAVAPVDGVLRTKHLVAGERVGDDVGSSGIVASRHWENPRRILSRGKMSVASDMAGFRFGAGTSRANAP